MGPGPSMRLAEFDFVAPEVVFERAFVGAADHGVESGVLGAGNQAKGASARAGQHRPVGVSRIAERPGVFKQEESSRFHLFRNPILKCLKWR